MKPFAMFVPLLMVLVLLGTTAPLRAETDPRGDARESAHDITSVTFRATAETLVVDLEVDVLDAEPGARQGLLDGRDGRHAAREGEALPRQRRRHQHAGHPAALPGRCQWARRRRLRSPQQPSRRPPTAHPRRRLEQGPHRLRRPVAVARQSTDVRLRRRAVRALQRRARRPHHPCHGGMPAEQVLSGEDTDRPAPLVA